MATVTGACIFFALEMGFSFVGFFLGKIVWDKDKATANNQVSNISNRKIRI